MSEKVRVHGRSGGKRDFVGCRAKHKRRADLEHNTRISLLNRLKICLGLVQRPSYDRLSRQELARIIDDAETENWL